MLLSKIAKSNRTYIIAEIGINHNGSIDRCVELIDAAKMAGADAVKLQTIDADENYIKASESYAVFKKNSLTKHETCEAFKYANQLGIDIFTTVGDLSTLEWVEELNPIAYKISSGLATHIPLIKALIDTKRSLLLSTGMSDLKELDPIVELIQRSKCNELGIFQCTSLYPAPPENLNLSRIHGLGERYNIPVGFSDHSLGIEAVPLAVAVGAKFIEKHFTLDCKQPGVDHAISIEPCEMKEMVSKVRSVEKMLGDSQAGLSDNLIENKNKYQRCIVARKNIECGEKLTLDNITIKRPLPDRRGLLPADYEFVLGSKAKHAILQDDPITQEVVCLDE